MIVDIILVYGAGRSIFVAKDDEIPFILCVLRIPRQVAWMVHFGHLSDTVIERSMSLESHTLSLVYPFNPEGGICGGGVVSKNAVLYNIC